MNYETLGQRATASPHARHAALRGRSEACTPTLTTLWRRIRTTSFWPTLRPFVGCSAWLGWAHEPARRLQPKDAGLVRRSLRTSDLAQELGWPAIASGEAHADPGSDRVRQDACRLSLRHRPLDERARKGPTSALRVAAEGAELRHRAQPPHRCGPRLEAQRRRPHRGHLAARPPRCCASTRTS